MKHRKVPCLYHPTTTVFIDDNQRFLEGIKVSSNYDTNCLLFDNPMKAVDFILQSSHTTSTAKTLFNTIKTEIEPEVSHKINADTQSAYTALYNQQRFMDISTIVIDYAMPSMNGVEVCKALELPYIKKIMLTGEADENLAVEAFNAGIINKFLRKTSVGFTSQLYEALSGMQEEYFEDISQLIRGGLTKSTITSHMHNSSFAAFFYDLLHSRQIVEFYVHGQLNNFLLLSKNTLDSILLVRNKKDLTKYIIAAKEDKAPVKIIKALENIEVIPFFGPEDKFWETPSNEWNSVFFPSTKIGHTDDLYYAIVETPEVLSTLNNKILYYDQFKMGQKNYLGS